MYIEELASVVVSQHFPKILGMYAQAMAGGITDRSELLSDYQLGIATWIGRVEEGRELAPDRFLHYRGLLEVQRQFRLRSQKSLINVCPSGHTYAFNKKRVSCPKCHLPFDRFTRNEPIQNTHTVAAGEETFLISDFPRVIDSLNIPQGQSRIFKVLASDTVLLSDEHPVTAASKVLGISRSRITRVLRKNREALKAALDIK